jgi:hypothetical protein
MTEPEYVEHIRRTASAYLAKIEAGAHSLALNSPEARAWANTKDSLSPFTMIEMCDAWLAVPRQNKHSQETPA